MLASILFATVGLVGMLLLLRVHFSYRTVSKRNHYMQLVILIHSVKFILFAVLVPLEAVKASWFLYFSDMLFCLSIPLLYLFFKNLVSPASFRRQDMLHFVMPAVLLLLFPSVSSGDFHNEGARFVFGVSVLALLLYYTWESYHLLSWQVWTRNVSSVISDQQHRSVRNWTIFLFAVLCMGVIRVISGWVFNGFTFRSQSVLSSYWIAPLLWLLVFIKLLIAPHLLYGYSADKKEEDPGDTVFMLAAVWSLAPLQTVNTDQDKDLQQQLLPVLEEQIHRIEELLIVKQYTRMQECTVEEVADALSMPVSHLNYIFRYHSRESFLHLKKIIRVEDAIRLLKSGYLYTHTPDALAAEVGFGSYASFYKSFVGITGKSPKDFVIALSSAA